MPNLYAISNRRDLQEAMNAVAEDVAEKLNDLLPAGDLAESRLFAAMRHGSLVGGKRLRPFLLMSSAKMFGVDYECALRAACAVELVHCYSLIHDDLPSMYNADLRRGKPTVHKAFDDATAILAGYALLTYAFEILAHHNTHADPNVRCQLVADLAKASGPTGLVGGQMLDLMAEKEPFDLGQTCRLQRMKTGELIAFSCAAGAVLGKGTAQDKYALQAFAYDLGLAFQITDDLLDVEGTPEETGKPTGQDVAANKATFVSILGVERARSQARMLSEQAVHHLGRFDSAADTLREIAEFVVNRSH